MENLTMMFSKIEKKSYFEIWPSALWLQLAPLKIYDKLWLQNYIPFILGKMSQQQVNAFAFILERPIAPLMIITHLDFATCIYD